MAQNGQSGVKKCNKLRFRARKLTVDWKANPSVGRPDLTIRKDVFEEELHIFLRDLRQYGTAADCAVETEVNVPIISTPQGFNEEELYVDLEPTFGYSLFLKCEGFNFAGSIKLKAAAEMIEAAERDGVLTPGSVLVESSSGNLGVALSMIAANKGYGFLCVTDSRCNLSTKRLMQAFGSQVHVITEPDPVDGLLGARINYVRALCASDDRYVWLNQYSNPQNWMAHYRSTAPAIARQFPRLDVLFVGAGPAEP